jgi:hypothetical protein
MQHCHLSDTHHGNCPSAQLKCSSIQARVSRATSKMHEAPVISSNFNLIHEIDTLMPVYNNKYTHITPAKPAEEWEEKVFVLFIVLS